MFFITIRYYSVCPYDVVVDVVHGVNINIHGGSEQTTTGHLKNLMQKTPCT